MRRKNGSLRKRIKKSVVRLVLNSKNASFKPSEKFRVRPSKLIRALAAACVIIIAGCSTVDQDTRQPNDQKSLQTGKSETRNVAMFNSNIYVIIGMSKIRVPFPTT